MDELLPVIQMKNARIYWGLQTVALLVRASRAALILVVGRPVFQCRTTRLVSSWPTGPAKTGAAQIRQQALTILRVHLRIQKVNDLTDPQVSRPQVFSHGIEHRQHTPVCLDRRHM